MDLALTTNNGVGAIKPNQTKSIWPPSKFVISYPKSVNTFRIGNEIFEAG